MCVVFLFFLLQLFITAALSKYLNNTKVPKVQIAPV